MKAIIMAGGKGTRIASVNSQVPKPMIQILGKPILQYQIENLKKQGISEFVLVCGHLREVVRDYFGDGSKFGVNIGYEMEDVPLGTAGALSRFSGKINDDFFLINGDIIFDIDINRMLAFHRKNGALATLFTHPNAHPYDSSLIAADCNGMITAWKTKEEERGWMKNLVNAGIHLLSDRIFTDPATAHLFKEEKKLDLDRDVLRPLVNTGKLYSYKSPEYVVDMGTPDRYESVTKDIENGKPESRNLSHRQKAVFLDRDGTINEYVGFLTDIDDFRLLPNAAKAVKLINSKGYLAVVITNQPVIARGEVTFDELDMIHNKMESLLGEEGAYIDGIYFCPHHPDKGFDGEVPELKIKCECRKPSTGLVKRAAEDFNIDISSSWFVGDAKTDVQTGKNAGCKTAFIGNDSDSGADIDCSSLYEFALGLE